MPETPDPASHSDPAHRAAALAEELLRESLRLATPAEQRHGRQMAGLVADPAGKQFTVRMADEVFRSSSPKRQAQRLNDILARFGAPQWLPGVQRALLAVGAAAARVLPGVAMPAMRAQLRRDTARVILDGDPDELNAWIAARRADGARINVNQLGEAVLGEREAARRLEEIVAHLRNPAIECVSVKLSSLFSQIDLTAWQATLDVVRNRLRTLYRAAIANPLTLPDGTQRPKFVNLDMEEYRDLRLTAAAFQDVLDEPEFATLCAGIVLQAYLPDSREMLVRLADWAQRRHRAQGGIVRVRLVKGANLAMERVESELHGWPQAPFATKREVDANYRGMMDFALDAGRLKSMHIGIASHNLFDLALALTLAADRGLRDGVEIEMLAGMADHQARAVQAAAGGLLVYAPVVRDAEFLNAMAYLVRRLDENTAPANFLHDLFGLTPGSPAWERQKRRFLEAWDARESVGSRPQRTQNRLTERTAAHFRGPLAPFRNEPDTDWSLPDNLAWADRIRETWSTFSCDPLPLVADGSAILRDDPVPIVDPSRPGTEICRASLAGTLEVDLALRTAVDFLPEWSSRPVKTRAAILRQCAAVIASRRGELIGAMMRETAKSLAEADTEVSEAVDFARYYAGAFDDAGEWLRDLTCRPAGPSVVAPPWNFPCAIPCSGITAALMAGNTVILKPAPEAILTAWTLANCLWDGGVPRRALQFLPCPDDDTGEQLLTDSRTAVVILTGARDTANLFLRWKPEMRLMAETSGKNALVVTAAADRDLAIRDLVRSAFGHSGQKCSAASLAILEAEVYDDPVFRRQLRDAAASLTVGAAHAPGSVVTPLIREPGPDLLRALTTLDPGEEWLLEPCCDPFNPRLWAPGIRLGVRPGSWFHRTECFGPVLGVIRADSLDHAIGIQNDGPFGLTAGIHSLDESEIARWRDAVQAGNGYINRPITGAIVNRQPFGGWKRSSVGPGAKAGGPNYVFALCDWEPAGPPARLGPPAPAAADLLERFADIDPLAPALADLRAAAGSYTLAWREVFAVDHDPSALACESNDFRYRPDPLVVLRVDGHDDLAAVALAALASAVAGVPLAVSARRPLSDLPGVPVAVESADRFAARLRRSAADHPAATVRTLTISPPDEAEAIAQSELRHIAAPVLPNGRLELLRWTREQCLTETRHRYGTPRPPHRASRPR